MLRKYLPHVQDIVHITVTVILVPTFYYFEVCIVLPTLFDEWSNAYCFHLLLSFFLLHNIVGNMCQGMLRGPGTVQGRILQPKTDGWRVCTVCECLAPPRSWHCPTCNICVLKRDHHCNFFGCCIGYFNHRYFYMFVFYIFFSTLYSLFFNLIFVIYFANINMSTWFYLLRFLFPLAAVAYEMNYESLYVLLLIINFIVVIFSGFLLIYHFRVIIRGKITPELRKELNVHYDHGWKNNLMDVLGKNWYLTWVSPFYSSPMLGDGICWITDFTEKGK